VGAAPQSVDQRLQDRDQNLVIVILGKLRDKRYKHGFAIAVAVIYVND
jgi:hypothetical protein